MSAEASVTEDPDGWTVRMNEAENAIIRFRATGKRIIVAFNPDDDDVPSTSQPLNVKLGSPTVSTP